MHSRLIPLLLLPLLLAGCFAMRPSRGGGQTPFQPPRDLRPADVALPAGYSIEVVARDLTFPSGVAFDAAGTPHVVEAGYSDGEAWTTPRLLRIEAGGTATVIATGGNNGPWNGVTFHEGHFWVAEGGQREGGRILRISPAGEIAAVLSDLPSLGDHHTNGPVVGADGWIYFAQGTATNSGVVGVDNAEFGWLHRNPRFHDIPCRDVTLAGKNFTSSNPLEGGSPQRVTTGAFVPFGTATAKGQVIPGRLPCNGAVMRIRPDGTRLELFAWGLRNPFGLAFTADGRLFVTDNGYDSRGSRPVFGAGDLFREVRQGQWYGWPDYYAHIRLGDSFTPPGGETLEPLLREMPGEPPRAAAALAVHSASTGFDFDRQGRFGPAGLAYVAQFGDMAPGVGKVMSPAGFKVVRVNPESGIVEDFAVNRGRTSGPASFLNHGGLERPVAARFDPTGNSLYIVDFGVMTMTARGPSPHEGTGVLWRIRRQ